MKKSPRLAPEAEFEDRESYEQYLRRARQEQIDKTYRHDRLVATGVCAAIFILTAGICALIVWLSKPHPL